MKKKDISNIACISVRACTQIPSDPKMLLPPLDLEDVGKFALFSVEKEMKRSVHFPKDLNLPLSALYIDQYDVEHGVKLDPKDKELLDDTGDVVVDVQGGGPPKMMKRKTMNNASWLMRTKYISSESGATGLRKQSTKSSGDGGMLTRDEEIMKIEESFEVAKAPLVHPKNPSLNPVEVLPILPDEGVSSWQFVLANFDSDPMSGLKHEGSRAFAQSLHLKVLEMTTADGKKEKFTVLMAPRDLKSDVAVGISDRIPGNDLQGDYDWVRRYDSTVRYDDRAQTFLFRNDGESLRFSDLTTKLQLRKRKRVTNSDGTDTDPVESLKPEKFIVRQVDDMDD